MNPVYALMESRYRWLILAAFAFGAGVIGAIAMLVYAWPYWLARAWFYLGFIITIGCLIQAFRTWRAGLDLSDIPGRSDSNREPGPPVI